MSAEAIEAAVKPKQHRPMLIGTEFRGFAYYRRFRCADCPAMIATANQVEFVWDEECLGKS